MEGMRQCVLNWPLNLRSLSLILDSTMYWLSNLTQIQSLMCIVGIVRENFALGHGEGQVNQCP